MALPTPTRRGRTVRALLRWPFCLFWLWLAVACAVQGRRQDGQLHRWWSGLGPVVSHDTFPSDCRLCHRGARWNELVENFKFDHGERTGVPLLGAHAEAKCLRCHNDRGPVGVFAAQGCAGCHADPHQNELGARCDRCHNEIDWRADEQRMRHFHGRFPLVGSHMGVACHRCHAGAFVGNYVPTDPDCVSCHLNVALQTDNPPHAALGWVDNCDRCHIPTRWRQAVVR